MINKKFNNKARKANVKRPKRKKNNKKKKTIFYIVLLIAVLFTAKILSQEYTFCKLESQEATLKQQLQDEKIKTDELKEEIKNSDSKSYIEYLARKYLGLIYPGEKIYTYKSK